MPKASDIPSCPQSPALPHRGVTHDYQISLVTPMFGGGTEAGVPDERLPIRATAIRGHLQFWWRATKGRECETHQELFARHAEIWGTTERASEVHVEVTDVARGNLKPCGRFHPREDGKLRLEWDGRFLGGGRVLPYALFPFQGKVSPDSRIIEKEPSLFLESATFTLRLRFAEELRSEVETAVAAWANFGGLGARTRRGCGALLCKKFAPRNAGELEAWFRRIYPGSATEPRQWPTMPDRILAGSPAPDCTVAWRRVIGMLQEFRQGVGVGRNAKPPNSPGRSRFPEAETIRNATGMRMPRHAAEPHIPTPFFPRAEFGLPIVFHFQGTGDPKDTELYPEGEGRERMASPLILKPLAFAEGGATPLVLRLNTPSLNSARLKQGKTLITTGPVRGARLSEYWNSPLGPSRAGSAIEAFLQDAMSKGMREVKG